tara:strand:- start:2837 stop:3133 length:297 start_codon:yes stop_codon:yes gene_type:complete
MMNARSSTKASRSERRRLYRGQKPNQAFNKEVLLRKTHDSGKTKTSKRDNRVRTKSIRNDRFAKYSSGFADHVAYEMVHTNTIQETVFLEYMKHFEKP